MSAVSEILVSLTYRSVISAHGQALANACLRRHLGDARAYEAAAYDADFVH
jgi:hypothetical protein